MEGAGPGENVQLLFVVGDIVSLFLLFVVSISGCFMMLLSVNANAVRRRMTKRNKNIDGRWDVWLVLVSRIERVFFWLADGITCLAVRQCVGDQVFQEVLREVHVVLKVGEGDLRAQPQRHHDERRRRADSSTVRLNYFWAGVKELNSISGFGQINSHRWRGGGGFISRIHSRCHMIIDPRMPTVPGRSTWGVHRPGRHRVHQ